MWKNIGGKDLWGPVGPSEGPVRPTQGSRRPRMVLAPTRHGASTHTPRRQARVHAFVGAICHTGLVWLILRYARCAVLCARAAHRGFEPSVDFKPIEFGTPTLHLPPFPRFFDQHGPPLKLFFLLGRVRAWARFALKVHIIECSL